MIAIGALIMELLKLLLLFVQVPETSFGVPYIEFTASEATLNQVASFKGGTVPWFSLRHEQL